MTHKSRSNRKKNEARRRAAAEKQRPLPPEEVARRTEVNAAAKAARYPSPPRYRGE